MLDAFTKSYVTNHDRITRIVDGHVLWIFKFWRTLRGQTCTSLHDGLQWSNSVEQAHHDTRQMTNQWSPEEAQTVLITTANIKPHEYLL